MYMDPEYVALAMWARSKADQLAEEASSAEIARMEETYLTSFRYEYLFWEMAYRGEQWAV